MICFLLLFFFFFSSRRRHTRFDCDWSSDVCSSDLGILVHLSVAEQHLVQRLAAVFRLLCNQFGRPHLLHLEALGEFHQLPQVGARLRSEERRVGKEWRSGWSPYHSTKNGSENS